MFTKATTKKAKQTISCSKELLQVSIKARHWFDLFRTLRKKDADCFFTVSPYAYLKVSCSSLQPYTPRILRENRYKKDFSVVGGLWAFFGGILAALFGKSIMQMLFGAFHPFTPQILAWQHIQILSCQTGSKPIALFEANGRFSAG